MLLSVVPPYSAKTPTETEKGIISVSQLFATNELAGGLSPLQISLNTYLLFQFNLRIFIISLCYMQLKDNTLLAVTTYNCHTDLLELQNYQQNLQKTETLPTP
jgi:hypothetical protein